MTALAHQIRDLDHLLAANLRQVRDLVTAMYPTLLEQPGIGPATAAVALISWSHHGRVRSEAAFAVLAGVSPVPASSGRTVRHRLNRGGDRTLNFAIHTIAKSRQRYHQPTKDYITRRTAEGRTPCEIIRVLKRYIARYGSLWLSPSLPRNLTTLSRLGSARPLIPERNSAPRLMLNRRRRGDHGFALHFFRDVEQSLRRPAVPSPESIVAFGHVPFALVNTTHRVSARNNETYSKDQVDDAVF